jgi:hypothetical protein
MIKHLGKAESSNILNLSKMERLVVKQLLEGKYHANNLRLPTSRAMKYRLLKSLERKKVISCYVHKEKWQKSFTVNAMEDIVSEIRKELIDMGLR